jgi:DNA-directed RNA polymerase subunit N (RpoN/RPB10)
MLIPVRCWSCGKVIAHKYAQYKEVLDNDGDTDKVLDDAGITRYCCRRMFVGHIDLLDEIAPFSVAREEL